MANEFRALGSALYGVLGTISYTYHSGTATVTSTLGCYDSVIPQGNSYPGVVFQLESSLSEYTFGTQSGESADYLVKVVSNRKSISAEAYDIYDQTHAVLQDAALTITGHYPLRVRRTSRFAYQDSELFWHVGGVYRVDAWEA